MGASTQWSPTCIYRLPASNAAAADADALECCLLFAIARHFW